MAATSPLEALGYPLFHPVGGPTAAGLEAPPVRYDQAQRTRVRSLEGMQKEALVTDSASGETWRLVSDEGDYLDGDDVAACPLSFVTTGMVSSFATRIDALADARGVSIRDLTIVQDNFYTMQGSALRGDMTGGALPPELDVRIDADAGDDELRRLVEGAVATAPVTGLLGGVHESRFALALNGSPIEPDRVEAIDGTMLDDPLGAFESLDRTADDRDPPVVRHTGRTTEAYPGDRERYTAGSGSSLQEEQDRVLHLRGTCTLLEDGRTFVEQKLYSPRGSVFEFYADPPGSHSGGGRAPSPMTYVAAGIGFCFMTQFGRYADIVGKDLPGYRIVQDTHVGAGDVAAATAPVADPVETHVFLESTEGEAFARTLLDMAEQTCFLHALCRTDLTPAVELTAAP